MADRICIIPDCGRRMDYVTIGVCKACYKRAHSSRPQPRLPDVRRFEKRIQTGNNGCWIWTGQTSGRYGRIAIAGRVQLYAHRWSYEYHRAPIPEGLEIDHLCRVTLCVNPWHLEPVTPEENRRRRHATQTHCKHGHEFTEENTYWSSSRSHRICKACKREARRRAKAKA